MKQKCYYSLCDGTGGLCSLSKKVLQFRDLKEGRAGATLISGGRGFHGERPAGAKALRWEHVGGGPGAAKLPVWLRRVYEGRVEDGKPQV